MRRIKLFEEYYDTKFQIKDIRKCILKGGVIYATIINGYPGNDPESPVQPLSIDDDGDITVDIDGGKYVIKLKNVEKIDFYDYEDKKSFGGNREGIR